MNIQKLKQWLQTRRLASAGNGTKSRKLSAPILGVSAVVWFCIIAFGMVKIYNFGYGEGKQDTSVTVWPENPYIPKYSAGCTLVMGIHPKCPCSKGTLHDLERLHTHVSRTTHTVVLFYTPTENILDEDRDFAEGFGMLANVNVIPDPKGQVAALFGIYTSGDTRLYHPSGKLLFAGGLAMSRGHEGWSTAATKIVNYIKDSSLPYSCLPAFGCQIQEKQ